jgi:Fe-S-cluster containining protein
VEREFRNLEKEVAAFQQATKLSCLARCGKCCQRPDIAATPLEFLPLAYHLFKSGEAEAWYYKLGEMQGDLCPLFQPLLREQDLGFCGNYPYRGLICRLFGYAATTDKWDKFKLVTCKPLKTEKTNSVEQAQAYIDEGGPVPIMRNYQLRLMGIAPELSRKQVPIWEAIREALQVVLSYYAFRRPRKSS